MNASCADEEGKFDMKLDFLWLIVSALLGCYVFIFWFLRRVNEWYYVGMVGKSTYHLPPGDMGWPFLGNMLPLFKSIRSADTNSFIYGLISRSVSFFSLSLSLQNFVWLCYLSSRPRLFLLNSKTF